MSLGAGTQQVGMLRGAGWREGRQVGGPIQGKSDGAPLLQVAKSQKRS